jgi:CRP/FNR family transcriptional regulator, cyclic AMP receptor protein
LLAIDGVSRSIYQRSDVLFAEGDPAHSLYYVESGLVKIVKKADDPAREVLLALVSEGEVFGEQAVHAIRPRSSLAQVLERAAIHTIPRRLFLDCCASHGEVWHAFAEFLVERKEAIERKMELLISGDVERRILLSLLDLADHSGIPWDHPDTFAIGLSQRELASLIGATRETTSTVLNALARRGLIGLGRRRLEIPSIAACRAALKSHR